MTVTARKISGKWGTLLLTFRLEGCFQGERSQLHKKGLIIRAALDL